MVRLSQALLQFQILLLGRSHVCHIVTCSNSAYSSRTGTSSPSFNTLLSLISLPVFAIFAVTSSNDGRDGPHTRARCDLRDTRKVLAGRVNGFNDSCGGDGAIGVMRTCEECGRRHYLGKIEGLTTMVRDDDAPEQGWEICIMGEWHGSRHERAKGLQGRRGRQFISMKRDRIKRQLHYSSTRTPLCSSNDIPTPRR